MTIYESLGIEKDLLDIEIPKDTILDNLQRVTLPNSAEYYFSVIDRVVLRASINRSGYDLQIIEVKLNDAKYISEISFIIQTAIKYQIIFIFSFDNRYLFARRSFKLTEMTEHVYSEHLSASSDWIYEESLIDDILMFNTIEEIQEDNEENLLWQEDSEYPIYKLFSDITNNIVKLNSCVLDSNVVCLRQFCDWYSGHSVQSHFGIREIINKIIKRDGVELLNDTIFFEKNILSHEICSLEDAKFLRDVDHLGRYPYKYFDNIQLLFYEEIEEYVLDNIYKIDSYQAYNSKQFIEETLDAYYKLVGHYPLLDEKEEKSLLKKMKDGDTEAYNRLVCSNLRLVVHVAKKYINRGLDVDDLIQEGTLGLITALKRYDAKFHSRISTYAMYWIKQSIQRAIYDTGNLIRFPVHMHETINTFKSTYKKIEKEQGNIPTVKMMADTLGCSEERIVEISKFVENNVIYDDTINDAGDTVFDLINDDQNDSAERFVYNKKLKEQVLAVLDTLTPREEKVLRLRYGIDDGKPKTLEEVGQHFNNTRERIRQIEAKALRKLRHPSRSKRLKDYLYESYDDAQIDLTAVSELNLWINEHYERRFPLRLKDEPEYKNDTTVISRIDLHKATITPVSSSKAVVTEPFVKKETDCTYKFNYKNFEQLWFIRKDNVSMSFYKIEIVPEGLKLTFWCSNYNSTSRAFWIESCSVDDEKQTDWSKLVELDSQESEFVTYLIENKQKANRIEINIEVDKDSTTKIFSYPTLTISLNNITGEVKPFFSSCEIEEDDDVDEDNNEQNSDEYVTDFEDIEFAAYEDVDAYVEFCNFEVEDDDVFAKFWIRNKSDETIDVYLQDIYIDGKKISDYILLAEVEPNKSTFARIKFESLTADTYYNLKAYIEIDDEDADFIDRGDVFSIDVDFEDGTLSAEFDE